MIDATPAAYRIRVLVASGHGWTALSKHLQRHESHLRILAENRPTKINHTTVDSIAAGYADLVNNHPQPYGYAAGKAYGVATRKGWGHVDQQAVTNVLNGHTTTTLTRYEKYAVVYTGYARNIGPSVLAELAHLSRTRVYTILGGKQHA